MDPTSASAPAAPVAPWRNPMVLAIAAVALVVGLVAGFAIGFKVEQSRVKDDVNRLRDKIEELRGEREGGAARPEGRAPARDGSAMMIVGADGTRFEASPASEARS